MDRENTQKPFHEYLREAMAQKGVSTARLAELTDIQQRHIEALLDGRVYDLPPAPYVRGYITRIATTLGLDGEELRSLLQGHATLLRTSGAHDRLPINRYALQKVSRKKLFAGIVVILILGYIGARFNTLTGKPSLRIEEPATATIIVTVPEFTIRGSVTPSDKLLVNNEEIPTSEHGTFEKTILLQPGINTVHVIAKRLLGRTSDEIRQIIYRPPLGDTRDLQQEEEPAQEPQQFSPPAPSTPFIEEIPGTL